MTETHPLHPAAWTIMPLGPSHGWGVCGKYLTLELMDLIPLGFITESLEPELKNNRRHYDLLSKIHVPLNQLRSQPDNRESVVLPQPVLQTIAGANLKPWLLEVRAPRRIGYTFFERTRLCAEDLLAANAYFDWIVAGSSWCEEVLRNHGWQNCSTIIQGIDPELFHARYGPKQNFKDHFVIFSGGKLEFRKGQDLVLRAFKVLQDKYDDVLLVNAWYNMWDDSVMTLRFSPYIRFDLPKGDYFRAISRLLKANGIDPHNVVTLPPKPHDQMAAIYRDTDCGLFPNRCEGGTNLVLMEYMACAKPVIASYATGHKDILTAENSIPIRTLRRLELKDPNGLRIEQYADPDLDEIIAHLEWAYHHRDQIKAIGDSTGQFMQSLTWQKAAKSFLKLLQA